MRPRSFAAKTTTPGISPAFVAARSAESIWENVLGSGLVGASALARVALRRPSEPNAVSAVVFTKSRRLGRWIMAGSLRTGMQRHTAARADLPRTHVRQRRKVGSWRSRRADDAQCSARSEIQKSQNDYSNAGNDDAANHRWCADRQAHRLRHWRCRAEHRYRALRRVQPLEIPIG